MKCQGVTRVYEIESMFFSSEIRTCLSWTDQLEIETALMILTATFSLSPPPLCLCLSAQLAAQVLDDLDDEEIGFGLVDEKKDSAVARKLGKLACHWLRTCWWTHSSVVNDTSRKKKTFSPTFLMASPGVFTECDWLHISKFCRFHKCLQSLHQSPWRTEFYGIFFGTDSPFVFGNGWLIDQLCISFSNLNSKEKQDFNLLHLSSIT